MYTTLICAQDLARALQGPQNDRFLVLDCGFELTDPRAGRRHYDAGHLPGAFHVHLEDTLSGPRTGRNGRHPLPDRAALAQALARAGETERTSVVGSLARDAAENVPARGGRDILLGSAVAALASAGRLDEANVRHLFRRVLVKAGMRLIRFHDLRHTFASLLIQQGESLAYVKEQMGHKSIQITVDTYGHLVPGGNRAAVDRLDDEPTQPNATPAQPEGSDASEKVEKSAGEPRRNRTYNPQIKSLLLCQLS